jgi:hypothetical protein
MSETISRPRPPEELGRAVQPLPTAATEIPHPVVYSALRVSDKLNAGWIDRSVDTQGALPASTSP